MAAQPKLVVRIKERTRGLISRLYNSTALLGSDTLTTRRAHAESMQNTLGVR